LLSGVLSYDEFLGLMTVKMAEKDCKEEILKAFRLFDDDETGKISFKNLKRVAKELGENLTDEELQVCTVTLPVVFLSYFPSLRKQGVLERIIKPTFLLHRFLVLHIFC
jgi:hypothetical protein